MTPTRKALEAAAEGKPLDVSSIDDLKRCMRDCFCGFDDADAAGYPYLTRYGYPVIRAASFNTEALSHDYPNQGPAPSP